MPYQTMYYDDVCSLGSTGTDDELTTIQAFDRGLDKMEDDDWTLVHVIPQGQIWDDDGKPNGRDDHAFIFHKPADTPTGRKGILS